MEKEGTGFMGTKEKRDAKAGRNYNKWFLNTVKKTIIKYGMIEEGDRIALGVSGGKDSSALLYIMSLVQSQAPFPFSLQAVFVDLGWEMDISPLRDFCSSLKIPLHVEKTRISRIVFDVRQEKNPCSLCAKLRRGSLHKAAKELDCSRVALGHHLDDAVETFFLNSIYSGRINTFKPNTYLDRRDLYLVRPLICLPQQVISSLASRENLPVIENPCPVSGGTKRHEMGEIVDFIVKRYPSYYHRFITSLEKSGIWTTIPFSIQEEKG
jgi:tRNA 2-thiocytidine biosynthesis protein TtcA